MLTCARCGQQNPENARFCNACAAPLVEPGLARQERKFAAALFADLVGSTRLAEQEDPEVVQSMLARAFDRLAEEIERYGGLLEKFIGDAVLAVFGVPAAHEDDPERAVRAALRMHVILAELNRGFADEGKPQIAMRIGVEGGEVLVDLDRVAGPRDRMLTGDAVNTAARLQQAAEPGGVLVGPNVHAATRDVIDYRELPPLELKGKAEPVRVWVARRVKGREEAPLRLEASLIGRDAELALLRETVQRVQSERRPALVTVLGPAGVGKSRLARELFRSLEMLPETPSLLKGRCLAYGNVSYSALAEAVKSECGILEDDPPEAVAVKAGRVAAELFGDRELAPHIEALVGSGSDHSFSREELFDAWRRFLERIVARAPLMLLLEDVHWADAGLLDFVEYLADWAEGAICVVALARPELLEGRPAWGEGKRNYTAVSLDPLAPEETQAMLEELLSTRLPEDLTRTVIERGEGNPLFTEEIVRMLIDRGVIRSKADSGWEVGDAVGEVEVPRSIHALIGARLDSLPAEEKAVLQDAAVVGRTFWLGAVERLSGRGPQEAQETLDRLETKEIVVLRQPPMFSGEFELAFRHVLIRDAAYDSLPKSRRADKHVQAAGWIEEQAGERREEVAELLATHYVGAHRYLTELGETGGRLAYVEREGFRWSKAAGERALGLWQQREAVSWFRAALDLGTRVGLSKDEFANLQESYAKAGEEAEPHAEVTHALESALALYEELGSRADAGRVEAQLAYLAQESGELDAALEWANRALARLEPLGDGSDLALALHVLGWHEFRVVRFADAEVHLRRAIDIAERVEDQVTRGHAVVSLAFVLQQTERGEEAVTLFEDALRLAREVGDLSLLLRAQIHLCGALEEIRGDYGRAEVLVREGLQLARKAGNVRNVAWMEQMLSDLLFDTGRLDEAGREAEEALKASRLVGEPLVIAYALQRLAILGALRGRPDEAEQTLNEARPIIRENPEPWLRGWEPLIDGLIAQARGNDDEAARILAEGAGPSLDRIFVWGGKHLLLETVRTLVRVGRREDATPFRDRLQQLGAVSVPARDFGAWADGLLESEPVKARAVLAAAADRLNTLGQPIDFARCLVDLAEVEGRLGEDGGPRLAQARQVLETCGATLFLREVDAARAATKTAAL